MLRVFLTWAFFVKIVLSAIQADVISSLPGWQGSLPSKQYSGFLDSGAGHHMHYWFVESEGNPATDPVVLWVQGGPGSSSLIGFFTELGPFTLNDDSLNGTNVPTLFRNPYAWTQSASVLFWESPTGVGFSYCDGGCPLWNDTTSAQENYQFLCNWFNAYPEYLKNPFYIFGESYGGVYIPMLTEKIMAGGCNVSINLIGVGIGNGCTGTDVGTCAPWRWWNTLNQLVDHGFVSQSMASEAKIACEDSNGLTHASLACQRAITDFSTQAGAFYNYNIYDTCGPPTNTFLEMVCSPSAQWACNSSAKLERIQYLEAHGVPFPYEGPLNDPSILKPLLSDDEYEFYKCGGETVMQTYLNNNDVKTAIHVPTSAQWPGGVQYNRTEPDLISAMPSIISKFRVLIYSGDFDGQIPYHGTEDWTRGLGYQALSTWRPWLLPNGQVAGYVTEYDVPTEFTFLTVKAAGHMVPAYRPIEALQMFQKFLAHKPF